MERIKASAQKQEEGLDPQSNYDGRDFSANASSAAEEKDDDWVQKIKSDIAVHFCLWVLVQHMAGHKCRMMFSYNSYVMREEDLKSIDYFT